MTTPLERFKTAIDDAFTKAPSPDKPTMGDRLRGWMASWVAKGLEHFLEDIEPISIEDAKDTIAKIRANPSTPPEVRAYLDKFEAGGFAPLIIIGIIMAVAMIIQTVQTIWQPGTKQMSYIEERAAQTFRFDPISVITAWRRDPAKYEVLFNDLKDLGWSDFRVEAQKDISLLIPGVSDLIRMAVREAFTPEIAEKFGQYQDFPAAIVPWLLKQGLPEEWGMRYWAAHWDLPASTQGFEMLRRGIITEDELKLLLRALDVMPFWRDKLIDISWEVPTRVDVRRFWDMRTIDTTRMREIYAARGYHGKDLDDYVLWTKVYTAFPDLLAMYKNGWITIADVKRELVALGMDAERADEMIKTKIKSTTAGRTAAERDLTKADIIKGVKEGVITRAQGAEMLMDLNYDSDEAIYILDINIPVDEETKTVTLRELSKSDIIAGLKAGIVTEADARARLIDLRYSPDDADFILKLYKTTLAPPEEPKLKEAAKADILLGVKKGLITSEAGYLMLLDLDFTPEAAQFILMVHAEETPFSPRSYSEFKDITTKYRAAAGMEVKPVPDELKKVADEVVRLTRDVEALQRAVIEEKRGLISQEVLPETATAKLKELEVALHRAQAELERTQTEYQTELAAWRHGA